MSAAVQLEVEKTGLKQSLEPFWLSSLYLKNFRNHENLSLRLPSPAPIVLTGNNGAGKTSLLEAISLLGPGKGLRQASADKIIYDKAREDAWGISVQCERKGSPSHRVSLVVQQSSEGKFLTKIKMNQKLSSGVGLAKHLSLFWLTPAMARFFHEGSSKSHRRKFMDRLVMGLEPQHGKRLNDFERLKKQRLVLLESNPSNTTWLEVLEKQMAHLAAEIGATRNASLALLNEKMAALNPEGFPLGVASTASPFGALVAGDVASAYQQVFAQNRARDRAMGRTQDGPHQNDFFLFNETNKKPAAECSTGEIKALLIVVVLAAAHLAAEKKHLSPIVLLDEIAAHLDERRRFVLLNRLVELSAQFWLTGTDPKTFAPLKMDAHFFTIQPNQANPQ